MPQLPRLAAPAFALMFALLGTAPAAAQPIDITVPGGVTDRSPFAPSDRAVAPSWHFDYHPDVAEPFDPGEAALDSQLLVRVGPSINPVRAAVIDRHGVSLAEHQLICQSLYATYDPVSDTYYGPDGLPRNCTY